ncbi:lantibiotic dehydratase [Chitinophaga sp.]|uniref:lantibiotic dehydratase n=1 Tax=Chitinophaga sp. TaxID=1869181 RepID=UPI0031D7D210
MPVQFPYKFTEQVMLRIPALPYRSIDAAALEQLKQHPAVMEAVYLASPSLYDEFIRTAEVPGKKMLQSLYKYISRMCSRCTPFGLFAGIGMIGWSDKLDINVSNAKQQRYTRLDMYYLCQLAYKLSFHPLLRNQLRYYPNNTIVRINGQLRYIESIYRQDQRHYQVTAVGQSDYVEMILTKAATGASLNEMATVLTGDDVSIEEATEFVLELIDAQLLLSEIEPRVTGDLKYAHRLLGVIAQFPEDTYLSEFTKALEEVLPAIDELDSTGVCSPAQYKAIMQRLQVLPIPVKENHLFQVDYMVQQIAGGLSRDLQPALTDALEVLACLSEKNTNTYLQTFKEKFYERYEDQEVSLLECLDPDCGIVYGLNTHSDGAPLIDDLVLPSPAQGGQKLNWTMVQAFLHNILVETQREGFYEVEIDKKALDKLKVEVNWNDFPDTLNVVCKMGTSLVIENAGGSSAANMLGRFVYMDERIQEVVNTITQQEEANLPEGHIVAEIVHLPQDRIGNISLRPVLRRYELPYLCQSDPGAHSIPLDDLLVSIRNNQVYLRSRQLNKYIHPHLSTAHNYSLRPLPVYQFLCDLQHQDSIGGMNFSWGTLNTSQFRFFPRVKCGDIVLSPASWLLNKTELPSLPEKIDEFRNKWRIPDLVLIVDGDNELLIDFSNPLSREVFLQFVQKRNSLNIKEFMFDPATAIVKDDKGNSWVSQLVMPLIKQQVAGSRRQPWHVDNGSTQREFLPGSNWIYYKIYCGSRYVDRLLVKDLKPILTQMQQHGLIQQFFFIRYGDPEWHLRLRMLVNDPNKTGPVMYHLQQLLAPHLNGGVSQIELSTYRRELERYGASNIELTESFFYNDSLFVLELLEELQTFNDPDEVRWMAAVLSTDYLLNDFELPYADKIQLTDHLQQAFCDEFHANKGLRGQLNDKFRVYKDHINKLLQEQETDFAGIHALLKKRSEMNRPLFNRMLEAARNKTLEVPIQSLISSYLHMNINRIMRSRQRANELVIYYMLHKLYKSNHARMIQETTVKMS